MEEGSRRLPLGGELSWLSVNYLKIGVLEITDLSLYSNHLQNLLKHRLLEPTPELPIQ
jgi:hypothetical protein